METYLFKFSACLVVFWLVYILFLERQTMHRFKRFYLLAAIASALVIPTLTLTEYVEPTPSDLEVSTLYVPFQPSLTEQPQVQAPLFNLENVLWILYGLGVFVFAVRFLVNLFKMYKRISLNKQIEKRPFIYVLLEDCRIPHSFFKYLFFERSKYETDAIPDEVKLHEETHARQLHSLDIITIELLQIVFWFHPLIYILKHHIKLNHEFLADKAVLDVGIDTRAYQKTLLQFSSNAHEYQLSSTINYSSIKKRFTVMKTQTSKTRMWLSSLLLLPIIAILFYSFAEKEYVEKEKSTTIPSESVIIQKESRLQNYDSITTKYSEAIQQFLKGSRSDNSALKTLKSQADALYNSFTKEELSKNNILPPPPVPAQKRQNLPTQKEIEAYNAWAKKIHAESKVLSKNARWFPPINEKDLIKFSETYHRMSAQQKKQAAEYPFPGREVNDSEDSFPSATPTQQEKATAKQVAAYNTWAKAINEQMAKAKASKNVNDYPIVKLKEVNKYKAIYAIMTETQRKNSEAWPSFPPPPPPPPPAPERPTVIEIADYDVWAKKLNSAMAKAKASNNFTNLIVKQNEVKKYKAIYASMTEAQKKVAEPWPSFPPPPPPPPPAPKSKDKSDDSQNKNTIQPVEITIKKDKSLVLNGNSIKFEELTAAVDKLNSNLTIKEKRSYVTASIKLENNDSKDLAKKIGLELTKVDVFSNCIIFNNDDQQQKVTSNHISPNAGLTIEEAKAQQEKDLKPYEEYLVSQKNKTKSPWAISMGVNSVEAVDNSTHKQGPIEINGTTYYFTQQNGITTYYDNYGTVVDINKIPPPPPPPPPPAPLEHMKELVQKGATFYYEGKEINPKDAIDVVSKNQNLNIKVDEKTSQKPRVYIYNY